MNIWSPIAAGNGAYIIHDVLSRNIPGYSAQGYSPNLSYMPPLLYGITPKIPPDIVHTTPDYALFFKRHAPTVITFHNYVLDAYMRPFSSALQNIHYETDLKLFTRLITRDSTVKITAVSQFIADLVEDELRPDRKIKVIHNGIDKDMFFPKDDADYLKPQSRLKVLFSGNLTSRKGAQWIDEIAEGVKEYADIYVTLGLRGKQSYFSSSNIITLGHVPYSNMPALYRRMDTLLFPTVREGFGLAAAEAMACGLPVVCSDCSSLKEIVEHEQSGYRVPTGNVSAYCEAIVSLANSQDLIYRMGAFNRKRILDKFPLSTMLTEYTELFHTCR